MKGLVVLLVLFTLKSSAADCDDMIFLRSRFHATTSVEKLKDFLSFAKSINCEQAVPYYASAYMKNAQFVFSPIEKIRVFKKGKSLLERYIKTHPRSIEARYVRVLVQKNAPRFLSYYNELASDTKYINKHIAQSDLTNNYKEIILNNINS